MNSSVHATNKTKYIIVLGKDFTQGLDHTIYYAEKLYSISFTKSNTKLCLSLYYNGSNSYPFVNGTEIHKFKTKYSEIIAAPLCLENISRDFSVGNMKTSELNIHKYLMEKNNIKWYIDLLKNISSQQ